MVEMVQYVWSVNPHVKTVEPLWRNACRVKMDMFSLVESVLNVSINVVLVVVQLHSVLLVRLPLQLLTLLQDSVNVIQTKGMVVMEQRVRLALHRVKLALNLSLSVSLVIPRWLFLEMESVFASLDIEGILIIQMDVLNVSLVNTALTMEQALMVQNVQQIITVKTPYKHLNAQSVILVPYKQRNVALYMILCVKLLLWIGMTLLNGRI